MSILKYFYTFFELLCIENTLHTDTLLHMHTNTHRRCCVHVLMDVTHTHTLWRSPILGGRVAVTIKRSFQYKLCYQGGLTVNSIGWLVIRKWGALRAR